MDVYFSGGEFRKVVGGADHHPFGFHLVDAAAEELPEASGLLELARDRLTSIFSYPVLAFISALPEFARMACGFTVSLLTLGMGLRPEELPKNPAVLPEFTLALAAKDKAS